MKIKRTVIIRLVVLLLFVASAWFWVHGIGSPAVRHALRYRLKQATYVDASVASILFDVVRQHPGEADWFAQVYERQLANATVSVEFVEGCSLRDALEKISRAARCRHALDWVPGNRERSPILGIEFKRAGAEERVGVVENTTFPSREIVGVDPDHICDGGTPHKCPPRKKW
jgi:hypothetical protein